MRRTAWLLATALLAAGCASAPPDGGRPGSRHGPPHGGPPGGRARLFVSPAGEPFRRGPGLPPPAQQWRERADRNHDGVLDRAELVADAQAFFKVLDVDGDGLIAGPEITRYETEVVPEILGRRDEPEAAAEADSDSGPRGRASGGGRRGGGGGRGGGRGGGGPGGGSQSGSSGGLEAYNQLLQGAAPFSLLNDPEPVLSADYDLTHKITLAEFARKASDVFDRLDRNADGKLDAAELTPPERAHARRRR